MEEKTLDVVHACLILASSHSYQTEVVISALEAMKQNPKLSIADAMILGCEEWIK